jgi:hypothetical protein
MGSCITSLAARSPMAVATTNKGDRAAIDVTIGRAR